MGPRNDPVVRHVADSADTKNFQLDLPRAVRFYYGNLAALDAGRSAEVTDGAFADYAEGDYYIHERTGFIYEITNKSDDTCYFTYRACI